MPFALTGGTAVGTGRGDLLSPVLARTPLHWVLALSGTRLCHPRRLRRAGPAAGQAGDPPRVGPVQDILAALASGDPAALAAALGNDLQAAAISLQPGAAPHAAGRARRGCARRRRVRAPDPTVALLCADAESAGRVAAELAGSGTCQRSSRVATGAGARRRGSIGAR